MITIPDFRLIVAKLTTMPEVSQAEAMARFMDIVAAHDHEPEVLACMTVQIVGFALSNPDQEMLRRFIVWQCYNGPIMRS